MFEGILKFFRKLMNQETEDQKSKDTAKERLHLVLMQDRANVSVDFLELMKQEIIDVIKKYIDVDESAIDVRLTNKNGEDGENGAPALYANIPILNIRNDMKKIDPETGYKKQEEHAKVEEQKNIQEEIKEEVKEPEKQEENHDEKESEEQEKQSEEEIEKLEESKSETQDTKQDESSEDAKEEKKEDTNETEN